MMNTNSLKVYSALDFAHTGMCIIDRDYIVVFWNKRLVEWTSVSKDDIIGKNITQFCPALKERRNTIRLDQIFNAGPPVIFSSQIHKHLFPAPLANGEYRIQHVTVSAIPSHTGNGFLALFAVEDVTELTLRMSELDKARHEAEMANRSKSDFLANMSHEIRTPMNGVLGMCNILLNSGLTEEQTDYAYMIDHSAKTLLTIINDILDFSKIEAGKMSLQPAPFDLKSCLEEVVQMLSFASEKKGLKLEHTYPDNLPRYFIADEGRVRQILINLISNAVKFTEKGGVSITVNSESSHPDFESIYIFVKDTGIGIAEDVQTMLFNKFIQVDSTSTRKFQGTGLGLAISRHLARLMDGDITLKSTLGDGSEFSVLLKIPKADNKQIEEYVSHKFRSALPSSPTELFKARVLLAEDNQINQAVASHILERLQCSVTVVENGKEAVEILGTEKFDIVFMDCQMPVLDGYSATQTIRNQEKNGQHIPIVAMTAHAIEGDRMKCIDSGMDDYISKPIDMDELIRILDNFCGHLKQFNSISSLQPSILIADDDTIMLRELEQSILRHYPKSTIKTTTDGVEACMLLGNMKPDIFLCDILIPNMDGEAVIAYIKRNHRFEKTRIIVITALPGHEPVVSRIRQMGISGIVFKPVEIDKFIQLIHSTLLSKNNEPVLDLNDRIAFTDYSIDYRGLVESSFNGIGIFQNNRFIFSNAAFSRVFGKNVNSILGITFEELKEKILGEDICKFEKLLTVNEGILSNPEREIIRFRNDNHEILTLDIYSGVIQNKGSTARLLMSTDVSCWINNADLLTEHTTVNQVSPEVKQVPLDKKIDIFDIPTSIVSVDDLMDRLGEDEQFAVDLLMKFADSLPKDLEDLEKALHQHDFGKIEITAHRIKGASRNLSICGLMETMDVIEHAGRALNVETITDVFSEAKSQVDAFISTIKKFSENNHYQTS
jgi:PAS domain S-box-containing protein